MMKHLAVPIGALAATLFSICAFSAEPAPKPAALKCEVGPLAKAYGGNQWIVYSCDDNRTVVIVSAPGSPATPFYFTFSPTANGYRLSGEGTGNKDATAAAFNELKAYSDRDIAALIEQTKPRAKP